MTFECLVDIDMRAITVIWEVIYDITLITEIASDKLRLQDLLNFLIQQHNHWRNNIVDL